MSTSPKPAPRRLTVTYYVEPQNLRTITVPVNRANVLILGLGGAVVWALASGVYLGARFVKREAAVAPAATAAALSEAPALRTPATTPMAPASSAGESVIVQSPESEPVAETAEPQADPDAGDEPEAPSLAEPASSMSAETSPGGTPEGTAAAFGPPSVLADPTAALPVQRNPAPVASAATAAGLPASTIGARLAVTDPAFSYKPDERVFDASFKIQNKGKPEARGKTWGVATFESRSGKRLEIASADGVSYRAKSLTLKALQFPIPDDEPGFVAEVTIHVAEDGAEGELTSTYRLDESGAAIR